MICLWGRAKIRPHDKKGCCLIREAIKTCKVTSDVRGIPEEGDLKWDAINYKLQIYNRSAWEMVISS